MSYTCIHSCACMYAYIYIYTYMCVYIYIHICIAERRPHRVYLVSKRLRRHRLQFTESLLSQNQHKIILMSTTRVCLWTAANRFQPQGRTNVMYVSICRPLRRNQYYPIQRKNNSCKWVVCAAALFPWDSYKHIRFCSLLQHM